MKILVIGAGVIGCNLAKDLFRSGKDVTLLARGKWADEMKENGMRIKNLFCPWISVSRIPIITELTPENIYDVIFVVMRYTQVSSIIDDLRKNKTKNIVFVGNNVDPKGTASLLPEKMSCLHLQFLPGIGRKIMLFQLISEKLRSVSY